MAQKKFTIFSKKIPETKHDNSLVITLLKKIKILQLKDANGALKSHRKLDSLKYEVYIMMKKIIIKNINNYMKYVNNSPVTEKCFDQDEMESEAYIVFENCIKNFDVNSKYDFYFYYNKAMARNFYRMFDKEIRQKQVSDNYHSEKFYVKTQSQFINDESDKDLNILINSLNLNDDEKLILTSKLNYQSKNDFLKENKHISSVLYNSMFNKIKIIILNLQNNDEL